MGRGTGGGRGKVGIVGWYFFVTVFRRNPLVYFIAIGIFCQTQVPRLREAGAGGCAHFIIPFA